MNKWLLLQTGERSGSYNMALDEALMIWHREGKIAPVIRFYEWTRPTVSLGYFQRHEKEANETYIKEKKYDFVRRLTGGRTVLHDNEITYSIIVAENHEGIPKNVTEAYRILSEGLLKGLHQLNISAHFSLPEETDKESLRNPRSAVCFDASSYYEIILEGKKVIGSAQTRQGGVLLQHGSVPLTIDIEDMFSVVQFPNERVRQRLQSSFYEKAGGLNDITGKNYTREALQGALIEGFAQALQIEFQLFQLTEEQEMFVKELQRTKYSSDEWTKLR